jgi:2-polyprenyl-3-methyl-5-hydroxy-6-metoxy-1,4-benzoquinol methylase
VLALSILHLVADREDVIARVHEMLKPGGVFVTSTACLGDSLMLRLMGLVLPVGSAFGLLPSVKVFTARELRRSLTDAGFEIEHDWRPGGNKAVFIVARK